MKKKEVSIDDLVLEKREHELDIIITTIQQRISRQLKVNHELLYRLSKEDLILQLNCFFAGKKQTRKEVVFRVPKTWKDHFKLEHRDHWLFKRWIKKHPWELQYLEVDVSKYTLFPNVWIPNDHEYDEKIKYYEILPSRR